jgi:hypothetical protein
MVHAHSMSDSVEILKTTDQNPLNSNQVWLMYVEQPRAKLSIKLVVLMLGNGIENFIFILNLVGGFFQE